MMIDLHALSPRSNIISNSSIIKLRVVQQQQQQQQQQQHCRRQCWECSILQIVRL